jgi:hypothetical protein
VTKIIITVLEPFTRSTLACRSQQVSNGMEGNRLTLSAL